MLKIKNGGVQALHEVLESTDSKIIKSETLDEKSLATRDKALGVLKEFIEFEQTMRVIRTGATAFPEMIYNPPGMVGEVYRYILAGAPKEQPELALAAALTAVGTVIGRKVCTSTDLRTNMYFLTLIETGGGKEWPRRAIQRIFQAIGAPRRCQIEDVASDAAIYESISTTPSQALLLDEFGQFLKATSSGTHLHQIPALLLRLYGSANATFSGKTYADTKRNRTIEHPNISLLATTVRESFFSSITSSQVTDGFLNRLIFLESQHPDPPIKEECDKTIPSSIIKWFSKWEAQPISSGNMVLTPEPIVIPFTDTAKDVFKEAELLLAGVRQILRPLGTSGLYTRVTDSARRVALTLAVGDNSRQITDTHALYALTLVKIATDNLYSAVRHYVSDNAIEANHKRVLDVIRANSPISGGALHSKTRFITGPQRNDILRNLEASGCIQSLLTGQRIIHHYVGEGES